MGKKKELMMMPPELQNVVFPSCPVKQRMIDYCESIEEAKGLSFEYHITHDFQVDFCNRNKTTFFQKHEIRISHDGIPVRHFSDSSLEAVWEKFVNFIESIKKQKHKMTITTDLEFGQTVYFKNDPEWTPYIVTGVKVSPLGVSYLVCYKGEEQEAFLIELLTEKAEKATASFKKN
jgi:hypothetical protein